METKHTNLKEIVKLFNKIPHTDNKKNANTKTERNETNKVYGYMSEYNNIDMNKIGGYGNKKRGDQFKKIVNHTNSSCDRMEQLEKVNIKTEIQLGFGNPKQVIPELVKKNNCDTLVMGKHGHRTWKDIILGSTIDSVRHDVKVPLVLV